MGKKMITPKKKVNKDLSLFRQMSEPFPTSEARYAAINAFADAVKEARKTHKITQIYLVMETTYLDEDGDEVEMQASITLGDNLRTLSLLAQAYGREKALHDALMQKLTSGGK